MNRQQALYRMAWLPPQNTITIHPETERTRSRPELISINAYLSQGNEQHSWEVWRSSVEGTFFYQNPQLWTEALSPARFWKVCVGGLFLLFLSHRAPAFSAGGISGWCSRMETYPGTSAGEQQSLFFIYCIFHVSFEPILLLITTLSRY